MLSSYESGFDNDQDNFGRTKPTSHRTADQRATGQQHVRYWPRGCRNLVLPQVGSYLGYTGRGVDALGGPSLTLKGLR